MDILIGAAFIMNVCFKQYFKVYAYGILPAIFIVSVFNIYSSIKNKDYKSYRLFYSIFWISYYFDFITKFIKYNVMLIDRKAHIIF